MIGAVVLAALLTLPAGAAASTKSATTTLPGSGTATGTVKAKCPSGKRATGGGFKAPAVDRSDVNPLVIVVESRKAGQRSWQVSGLTGGISSAQPLTALVHCRDGAPKTKQKSATLPVAPPEGAISSAAASCGSDGKAQSGGFLVPLASASTPNQALIIDSFRSAAKSWLSRAEYLTGSPTLTSYADCAKEAAPKARPGSGVISSALGELKTALSGKCKEGTKVAAGGFSQPNATFSSRYEFPWQSFRTGKQWQISASHSGAGSTTLISIAYCI
jgi:hypothetical protein